jgi:hypothetical protein
MQPAACVPDHNRSGAGRRAGEDMDQSSAVWLKSSLSNMNGCVEVAFVAGRVALRDSKDERGPVLVFTRTEWEAFVAGIRAGEFDLQ